MSDRSKKPNDAPDPAQVAKRHRETRDRATQELADRNHKAHLEAKRQRDEKQRALLDLRKGLEF